MYKKLTRTEEHKLALWCMEQARLHKEGKLSKEQIKKLNHIPFPFKYYEKMAEDFERFEPYSCRIQMSNEEIKNGAKYKDLKQKGYCKIDDTYFILIDDFWRLTQNYRLSEEDVESMVNSQDITVIEET